MRKRHAAAGFAVVVAGLIAGCGGVPMQATLEAGAQPSVWQAPAHSADALPVARPDIRPLRPASPLDNGALSTFSAFRYDPLEAPTGLRLAGSFQVASTLDDRLATGYGGELGLACQGENWGMKLAGGLIQFPVRAAGEELGSRGSVTIYPVTLTLRRRLHDWRWSRISAVLYGGLGGGYAWADDDFGRATTFWGVEPAVLATAELGVVFYDPAIYVAARFLYGRAEIEHAPPDSEVQYDSLLWVIGYNF